MHRSWARAQRRGQPSGASARPAGLSASSLRPRPQIHRRDGPGRLCVLCSLGSAVFALNPVCSRGGSLRGPEDSASRNRVPNGVGGIGRVHRRSGPGPKGRKEREGVSHCCHPLEGVWLLGKECFEKLLRWGRSPPPPKFPPRLPPSVSLPLLELCLMNWRFFFPPIGELCFVQNACPVKPSP